VFFLFLGLILPKTNQKCTFYVIYSKFGVEKWYNGEFLKKHVTCGTILGGPEPQTDKKTSQ